MQNIGCLENSLLFFLQIWLCGCFRIRGLLCAVQLLKLFWAENLEHCGPVSTEQTEHQYVQYQLPRTLSCASLPTSGQVHSSCSYRVQVVLLNPRLLNLPFWKGSRRGYIPPCSSIDSSLVTPTHLRDDVQGCTALMLRAEQRGNGNAGTSALAQLLGWAKRLFLGCCFPAD